MIVHVSCMFAYARHSNEFNSASMQIHQLSLICIYNCICFCIAYVRNFDISPSFSTFSVHFFVCCYQPLECVTQNVLQRVQSSCISSDDYFFTTRKSLLLSFYVHYYKISLFLSLITKRTKMVETPKTEQLALWNFH